MERRVTGILDALSAYGSVITPPLTSSMWPMLRAKRDSVLLYPVTGPLAYGDVALYRTPDDIWMLHRVVGLTADGYLFRGDRNPNNDPPVAADAVVAVMRGFYRDDRYIPANAWPYRGYAALWPRLRCLRRLIIRIDRWIYSRHAPDGTGATP